MKTTVLDACATDDGFAATALLLCGSPKGTRSASWRFGAYLCDRLAAAGVEVRRRTLAPEGTLLEDVSAAELLLLVFPLYADGVPARLKHALMMIAEVLGERDLAAAGGLFAKTRRSLDLAAEALAQGRAIPEEAVALMREDLMPRRLYLAVANVGQYIEGVKHGLAFRMRENPFEK